MCIDEYSLNNSDAVYQEGENIYDCDVAFINLVSTIPLRLLGLYNTPKDALLFELLYIFVYIHSLWIEEVTKVKFEISEFFSIYVWIYFFQFSFLASMAAIYECSVFVKFLPNSGKVFAWFRKSFCLIQEKFLPNSGKVFLDSRKW